MEIVPKLADLLDDPAKVSALPVAAVPELRGRLAMLDSLLLARLVGARPDGNHDGGGDRLLTIKETAARLHCSEAWLYREAERLPFTVRVGRKLLFSESKMEAWIKARAGR